MERVRVNIRHASASSRSTLSQVLEVTMVFKPNYNQQRAERDRNKQAKKEAKLRDREEASRRKVEPDAQPAAAPDSSETNPG
jgi:hypothetical protein